MFKFGAVPKSVLGVVIGFVAIACLLLESANRKYPDMIPSGNVREHRDAKVSERAKQVSGNGVKAAQAKDGKKEYSNPSDVFDEVRDMVSENPFLAIQMVESLKFGDLRTKCFLIIGEVWAENDPQAFFEWASNVPNPHERSSALVGGVNSLLASGEVDLAATFIRAVPRGENRDDMIVFGLYGIANANYDLAIELSGGLSGRGAIHAAGETLGRILFEDYENHDIIDLLYKIPHGALRKSVQGSVLRSLAHDDPSQAFDWFVELKGFEDPIASRALASAFAKLQPEAGLSRAANIGNPKMRADFLRAIGEEWGRNDPASASEWMIKKIDSGQVSRDLNVFNGLISEWVQWRNEEPFQKIAEIEDDSLRIDLTLSSVEALSKFDPSTAATRLLAIPDSGVDRIPRVGSVVARQWLIRDPLRATEWVASLNSGPLKDAGTYEVIENILQIDKDPTAATQWLEGIDSPKQREIASARIDRFIINNP